MNRRFVDPDRANRCVDLENVIVILNSFSLLVLVEDFYDFCTVLLSIHPKYYLIKSWIFANKIRTFAEEIEMKWLYLKLYSIHRYNLDDLEF